MRQFGGRAIDLAPFALAPLAPSAFADTAELASFDADRASRRVAVAQLSLHRADDLGQVGPNELAPLVLGCCLYAE